MLLINEKPSFAYNQISMSAVDSYCLRAKDSCFLPHLIARVDICLESKSSFSSVSGGVSSFLWSMRPNTDAVRWYLHAENQSDVWLCPRVFHSISLICSEVTVRLLLNASTRVIISSLDGGLYETGDKACSVSSFFHICISGSFRTDTPRPSFTFCKNSCRQLKAVPLYSSGLGSKLAIEERLCFT